MGIDLYGFCDDESGRFSIDKPWRDGDYVCATDGRVLIRCDAELFPAVRLPEGRVPRFDDILEPLGAIKKWSPCKPPKLCSKCVAGFLMTDCDMCNGTGACECACGNGHDCGHCDGAGKVQDERCTECCYEFAGRRLAVKYMQLIAALPNCELGAVARKKRDTVYFRFDGGVGAIQPVVVEN